jgi:hypothetical protein
LEEYNPALGETGPYRVVRPGTDQGLIGFNGRFRVILGFFKTSYGKLRPRSGGKGILEQYALPIQFNGSRDIAPFLCGKGGVT